MTSHALQTLALEAADERGMLLPYVLVIVGVDARPRRAPLPPARLKCWSMPAE